MEKNKDWKKILESQQVLEKTQGVTASASSKFFQAAKLLNPFVTKIQHIEKKFPPGQIDLETGKRQTILHGEEFKRLANLCEHLAWFYHKNPSDPTNSLGPTLVQVFRMMDSWIKSVDDKQGLSDMIDTLLYDVWQAISKARKILKAE